MQTEDTEFSGQYNQQVFHTLYYSYKPVLLRMALLVFIGFLGRVLLLGNANVIGYWVDSFCLESKLCKEPPTIFQNYVSHDFLVTILTMSLVGFFFTLIYRVLFSRYSAQAVSRLYDEVTLRTSRYPMTFFDNTPVGRIVTRFASDYGNLFRMFGGPLSEFLSIVFDLLAMVILIGVASPYYLLLVLGLFIANYIVYRLNRDSLRRERRELSRSRSPSIAHFSETTQGAASIRTFLRQGIFSQRFSKLNDDFLGQKLTTIKNLFLFSFQMNSLTAILFLVTGLVAYALVQKNLVSVGSIGVAFAFITLSGNTVQMFFEWLAQFEEAMIGAERMDHYLRLPIEQGAKLPPEARFPTSHWRSDLSAIPTQDHGVPYPGPSADVCIENLSFRYGPNLPFVLKDISFKISAGEKIGVVGRTGSGKSSLIQCLFYLYPIEQGVVNIAGLRPQLAATDSSKNTISLLEYRNLMAFISQDPVLFRGTLRENLSLRIDVTEADIFEALERVGLKHWACNLPYGIDSNIDERGKNLSLGERQLVCMARCLLQKAPVVIMDEATASIDPQSEEIMLAATESFFKNRTQIIIAHRLSTLQSCDKILWLNQGKIEAFGPTEQVLAQFMQTDLAASLH